MRAFDTRLIRRRRLILSAERRLTAPAGGGRRFGQGRIDTGSLVELVERFEGRRFSTRDVLALIVAGLRGGGWQGSAADLLKVQIGGGPMEAAKVAATLLALAFSEPGDR